MDIGVPLVLDWEPMSIEICGKSIYSFIVFDCSLHEHPYINAVEGLLRTVVHRRYSEEGAE